MSTITLDSLSLSREGTTPATKTSPQEKLHEYVVYDPKAQATSNRRWQIVWKIAARVSIVAYIAIGIGLIFMTGAYSLFLAALTTLTLFPVGWVFRSFVTNKCTEKALTCKENVIFSNAILKKMKSIQDDSLEALVQSYGLDPSQLQRNPKLLKSFLARIEFYKEKEEEQQKIIKECASTINDGRAGTLEELIFSDFFGSDSVYRKIDEAEKLATHHRLAQAYCLKILQNLNEPTNKEGDYLKVVKGPNSEILLETKGKDPKKYSIKDILAKSPLELAKEIFGLVV